MIGELTTVRTRMSVFNKRRNAVLYSVQVTDGVWSLFHDNFQADKRLKEANTKLRLLWFCSN